MYVGHFAIGLALHEKHKEVPLFPVFIGVVLLDIVEGIFLNTGLAEAVGNLLRGPYLFFDLTFIDWDHSLIAAIFWSILWGLIFKRNTTVSIIAGIAVFSHYLGDLPFHNQDMAVYPYSTTHWGFGLWEKWGTWSWVLEGFFALYLLTYSWLKASRRYVNLTWPAILLLSQWVILSPWFSPLYKIAELPAGKSQSMLGISFVFASILPGLVLMWLIKHAENGSEIST